MLADRAHVLRDGLRLLARLGRAGVDLGAHAIARGALGLLRLLLGDLRRLLCLLLRAAVARARAGRGGVVAAQGDPFLSGRSWITGLPTRAGLQRSQARNRTSAHGLARRRASH